MHNTQPASQPNNTFASASLALLSQCSDFSSASHFALSDVNLVVVFRVEAVGFVVVAAAAALAFGIAIVVSIATAIAAVALVLATVVFVVVVDFAAARLTTCLLRLPSLCSKLSLDIDRLLSLVWPVRSTC